MTVKKEEFVVWAGCTRDKVLHDGQTLTPSAGWIFVESGDAGLTRRLKADGDYWLMVHRRRNRIEATGLWVSAEAVKAVKSRLEAERSDPAHLKKLEAGKKYRESKQEKYEVEFRSAVLSFLAFAGKWSAFAETLADAVTVHAVPVGSGTVARTLRIPLERRAEAAVIAWMRHQTTAYDNMSIARIKGERREVRRKLAERSRQLLSKYRSGEDVDTTLCPLAKVLK
ncbi:MAG: DUF2293 domain-containing protein [Victivallaceae bacterium]|jgi:hypothetical protein